jgi:hypothetical protein
MRLYVSVSVPLQITLGVLFTILPVRQIIGYFGKFGYFIVPHECSHTDHGLSVVLYGLSVVRRLSVAPSSIVGTRQNVVFLICVLFR